MSADEKLDFQGAACPAPLAQHDAIQLAHGGGGRLTQRLIEDVFARAFANPMLDELHDGARLDIGDARLAFSTDSFVVKPVFFPGGDIGSLAVHGTVNDLAMCGAEPLWLSAGFILEEGFPIDDLRRVVDSMQAAAAAVPVQVVTGDTKVVDRGKGDGIFINTAGIGRVRPDADISPKRARPGDAVLVSGDVAVHGMAIMSVREGLSFEAMLESDTAPLHGVVRAALDVDARDVHVLRDPTRGGLASTLNEIAAAAGVGVLLEEERINVPEVVRGACEILGLDPLYVANEGICLLIVAPESAQAVLEAIRRVPVANRAARIGTVTDEHPGRVVLQSGIGGRRVIDMLSGEQLPRIC